MNRLINISLQDDALDKTAEFIVKNFSPKSHNFERVACVFGGRRPAMFLRRKISRLIKGPYFPPKMFSMDEFVMLCRGTDTKRISVLDATYLLYALAGEHLPELLKGRESYPQFLPWANELVSFIEQLDLENIHDSSLINVQNSAEIGYDVPDSINLLLRHIVKLRRAYHEELRERKQSSRGMDYMLAGKNIVSCPFDEFDTVIFCGFFYLHKCEASIIQNLYARGKAVLLFQGSGSEWPVLKQAEQLIQEAIEPQDGRANEPEIRLYQAFDMHSQVAAAVEVIKAIPDKNKAVAVLPRVESLIPLLSQASVCMSEFNVSMGYPLKRSSLYALFELMFKAQESRRSEVYYTRDYLNLIRHPLVKNIAIAGEATITRILVHHIENVLTLAEKSPLAGKLFISLKEIEDNDELFVLAHEAVIAAGHEASVEELLVVLKELHYIFFKRFDDAYSFSSFAASVKQILDMLVQKSIVWKFPFNIKVAQKIYDIQEELAGVHFHEEHFDRLEIWQVFRQYLESALVSFTGSPLRGMQILGLFETRSLVFDDVIVLDANEGVLPKMRIQEPLIPREVMLGLGLNRLEKEEEIQRYQFMRLIAGAKRVHLVYEASGVKEKSRFIEEILWRRQKACVSLEGFPAVRVNFNMQLKPKTIAIAKDTALIEYLRSQTYSSSRIDKYLNCPLSFYYHYCLGLREPQNLLGDLESRHIGTFLHEFLENIFVPFLNRPFNIDEKFIRNFYHTLEERFETVLAPRIHSEAFLLKKIIVERMGDFIKAQAKRPVKKILSLECKREGVMVLEEKSFAFEYTADRVDELIDGSIEIIDYKSGSSAHAPKSLQELRAMEFTRMDIKNNIRSFQLPLYYHFVQELYSGKNVNALLYNLRTGDCTPFIKPPERGDIEETMHICRGALGFIFDEIMDINVPFIPDPSRHCDYCPFKMMCC